MRNRSPCPISGPQWLVLFSFLFFIFFYTFFDFPRLPWFQNRLGGDSKFCFLFFSLRHFTSLLVVTRDSARSSSHSVAWLQKLATPLGITRLQLSCSLFRIVAFPCLHLFLACVCLTCLSCYPYFDVLLYAMFICLSLHLCHAYHMPFHVICFLDVLSAFFFTNHITTLAHSMHMPFDMMFDVYML